MFVRNGVHMTKNKVVITVVMVGGMCFAQSAFGAAIGNTVWHDRNANGVQDAGEEGIPGVKLKLYNGDKVKKDKTNAQGRYKFKNLDAGHYTVVVAQETLPKGCYATYDRDGNKDGRYKEKYLKKDQYYRHIDFGYRCPDKKQVSLHTRTSSPKTGAGTIALVLALIVATVSVVSLSQYRVVGTRK
ncbi:MAG: hypothetical protein CR954_01010 [Candidatus Moraniibacteriota bacterium]|nr:MAG: hypothetical protein CR954_01010 [Candidatus Moranbacteria bacterium]